MTAHLMIWIQYVLDITGFEWSQNNKYCARADYQEWYMHIANIVEIWVFEIKIHLNVGCNDFGSVNLLSFSLLNGEPGPFERLEWG
jgi:hypothetical protein